jgi:hypothetical protein
VNYRLIPGGYIDETGPHRGVPPTQEDFYRIAILCAAHRTMFAEGKIKFQVHDPVLPQDTSPYMLANHIFSPYDAEIVQELPIEEVKRRYPGADIPGEDKS